MEPAAPQDDAPSSASKRGWRLQGLPNMLSMSYLFVEKDSHSSRPVGETALGVAEMESSMMGEQLLLNWPAELSPETSTREAEDVPIFHLMTDVLAAKQRDERQRVVGCSFDKHGRPEDGGQSHKVPVQLANTSSSTFRP